MKKNMPTLYNDGVLYMFDGNLFSTSFEGDIVAHDEDTFKAGGKQQVTLNTASSKIYR